MQSRAIDQAAFFAQHPLNFLLFYGNYEVINTIYLDDGSPLVDLSMELFNQSNQTVKFQKPTNLSASANNCHFYLSLEGNFTLEKAPEGWDFAVEQSRTKQGDNFYFLKKEGYDLQQKPDNGSTNKIVLVLKNFRAVPQGGTRTSRAEMTYGPLLTNTNNQPFRDNYGQYSSYGNTIFITNNRGGKKTLPLQVDFAAGNSVLNDGTATNRLELLIANKNWPSSNLSLSQDSEFVISFEMGSQEGAVATDTQVKEIGITSNDPNKWPVQHVANSTEWTVKPKPEINQLASDEVIKLTITNLVTSNSSGSGYLYVRYKNIPNYPDGQFVVPIEKSPLLYCNAEGGRLIGIGTTSPSEKLHIVGDVVLGKAEKNKKFLIHSRTTVNNDFLQITSDNSDGDWVWQQGIILARNGNVGIGTNAPSHKLEVSGNIKATDAIQPSAGNAEDKGIMFPKDIGDGKGDAAWIRYYARSGEACTLEIGISNDTDDHIALMPANGNVGIGTKTPSAKLHVDGRIKDKTGLVMPVGSILPYAGATAPEGWLLCQGQELDKTQDNNKYQDLFEIIGYTYTSNNILQDLVEMLTFHPSTSNDSGNKFRLPNLQGRIPAGFSSNDSEFNQLGNIGGSKTHTLTVDQMPSHNHGVNDPGHYHIFELHNGNGQGKSDDAGSYHRDNNSTSRSTTGISLQNTGGSQAHNNLQPYLTVNYIIKY